MGQALEVRTRFSLADYLDHEERSQFRSDFYQGELFAMAGTSDVHNEITGNLYSLLRTRKKSASCRAYMENVKLELLPGQFYVYPDVMLTCDPRDEQDRYLKRFPRILAEVLSPGTEAYDRNKKLPYYLQIPTLEALLFLSQSEQKIELFLRKGQEWIFSVHTRPDETLHIGDLVLSVAELYEGVNWKAMAEEDKGTETT